MYSPKKKTKLKIFSPMVINHNLENQNHYNKINIYCLTFLTNI